MPPVRTAPTGDRPPCWLRIGSPCPQPLSRLQLIRRSLLKVRRHPCAHLRLLDVPDHPEPPAAAGAVLEVDAEHALQWLRAGHGDMASREIMPEGYARDYYVIGELGDVLRVSRPTIYRRLARRPSTS